MDGLGNAVSLKPTVREVQEVVCAATGLTLAEMKSTTRKWRVSHPRQHAMALARELCGKSYPQLGRAFGGRDHTTCIFAVRKTAARLASDPDLEVALNRYRERIAELVSARAASMPAAAVDMTEKPAGDSSCWRPEPPKRTRHTLRTVEIIEQADWLGLGGELAVA